jgi:hypothetical protein
LTFHPSLAEASLLPCLRERRLAETPTATPEQEDLDAASRQTFSPAQQNRLGREWGFSSFEIGLV